MAKKTKIERKPEPVTWDDFVAESWQSFQNLDIHEDANIPPCTYPFKVGDDIRFGGFKECRVVGILGDGRIFLIRVTIYLPHKSRLECGAWTDNDSWRIRELRAGSSVLHWGRQ